MKNLDINSLSLKELKKLKTEIDAAIVSFEKRRKDEARAKLEEHARAMGFSLNELVGVSVARKRAPAKPKYANPADPSETWTGRGRKPRWAQAALAAGKSLDDLAI
jgi:DNA-binding protein H-NS